VAGLSIIKSRGGIAIVQDPKEALFSSMPQTAIHIVDVDYVLPVAEIASTLNRLVQESLEVEAVPMHNEFDYEEDQIVQAKTDQENGERVGSPSIYTCPDCGGVLWEMKQGELLHYRCHVGHSYSAESLLTQQSDGLEMALWTAIRALEERASLSRRLATRMSRIGQALSEQKFLEQAEEAHQRAQIIRQTLLTRDESLGQQAEITDPLLILSSSADTQKEKSA
jgi:two-component system, chemotaxis family, protein-glutamate methylesterase/glutaminase